MSLGVKAPHRDCYITGLHHLNEIRAKAVCGLPDTFSCNEGSFHEKKLSSLADRCLEIEPSVKRSFATRLSCSSFNTSMKSTYDISNNAEIKEILDIHHLDLPRKPSQALTLPKKQNLDIEYGKTNRASLFQRIKAKTTNALKTLAKTFGVPNKDHARMVRVKENPLLLPKESKTLFLKTTLGVDPVIERKISSGSFGQVSEVSLNDKKFAEKTAKESQTPPSPQEMLKLAFKSPDSARARLRKESESIEREATILMQLGQHPNIVSLEAFSDEGIYLELAQGNLSNIISEGSYSYPTTVRFMKELTSGLRHIHSCGFIHKDIKPSNILFDSEGHLRISDFGVSSPSKLDASFAGTPGHIAPEVYYANIGRVFGQDHAFRGQTCLVTPQADVWSLGVVFYQLLTGRHPYPRNESESSADYGKRVASEIVGKDNNTRIELQTLRQKLATTLPHNEQLKQNITRLEKKLYAELEETMSQKQLFDNLSITEQERVNRLDPNGYLRRITLACLHGNPGIWTRQEKEYRLEPGRRRPDSEELLEGLEQISQIVSSQASIFDITTPEGTCEGVKLSTTEDLKRGVEGMHLQSSGQMHPKSYSSNGTTASVSKRMGKMNIQTTGIRQKEIPRKQETHL